MRLDEESILKTMKFIYSVDERAQAKHGEFEEFKDLFNYNCFLTTISILENADTLTDSEWRKTYYQFKNNQHITYSLLNLPGKVPADIISDIVFNTDIVDKHIKDPNKQDILEVEMLQKALCHNISNVTVDEIYNNIKNKIYGLPNSPFGINFLKNINPHVLERICDRILKTEYEEDIVPAYKLLTYVNKDYVKKLFDRNILLRDQAASALINNIYLDPSNYDDAKTMEALFNDADFYYIHNLTDSMKKRVSEYYYNAIEENIENHIKGTALVPSAPSDIITRLIKSNEIDHDIEYQLLDLIFQKKLIGNSAYYGFIHNITYYTDNPQILNEIDRFPVNLILNVTNHNKNLTQEQCRTIADIIIKRYETEELERDEGVTLSDIVNGISSLGQYAELTDKQYEFVFSKSKDDTQIFKILKSDKTPIKLINAINQTPKLSNFSKITPKFKLYTQAVIDYRNNEISPEVFNFITEYIDKTSILATLNYCETTDFLSNPHITYRTMSLMKDNKDIANEIVPYMNKLHDTTTSNEEKAFLSHGIEFLKNEMNKENKVCETEKITSQKDVIKEIRSLPIFYRFNLVPSSYESLYKALKRFQELEDMYNSFTEPQINNIFIEKDENISL